MLQLVARQPDAQDGLLVLLRTVGLPPLAVAQAALLEGAARAGATRLVAGLLQQGVPPHPAFAEVCINSGDEELMAIAATAATEKTGWFDAMSRWMDAFL